MKSSPLFKVIFTLVRGNAWKAGTYGNMDVDKQDKKNRDDRQHPSIDLHCAITLGHVKNHHWLLLALETFMTDMLPNCGILFIVNDMFEAKR